MANIKDNANPVAALCQILDHQQVSFVFIRDIETVEKVATSGDGDVDMFCTAESLPKIREALKFLGWYNLFGGQTYVSMESDLVFDVYCEKYTRLPMLSAEEIFQGLKRVHSDNLGVDLPLLADHVLLAVLLLHPLDLTGIRGQRSYTAVRQKAIYRLWRHENTRERTLSWTRSRIGPRAATHIKHAMEKDVLELPKQANLLRLLMYTQRPENLKFLFKRLSVKVRPVPMHRGQIIAVMGVDGSGKSTLIDGLRKFVDRYYSEEGKAKVLYMGRQGGFRLPLSRLSRLKSTFQKSSPASTFKSKKNPDSASDSNAFIKPRPWKTRIRGAVFMIEFSLRLVELVFHKKVKRRIIITDRYIDDFIHETNHSILRRFVQLTFPKPVAVICIRGDCRIFFERKGEYSPTELEKHQKALKNTLISRYAKSNLFFINGNNSAKKMLAEALCQI